MKRYLARERAAFPRQIPDYDLFVCDGVPGPAQLTEWRRAGNQAPVLIVTARESFLDFLNRVRSLLRAGDTGPETLHAAGLEQSALERALPIVLKQNELAVAGMPADEVAAFRAQLWRIIHNLAPATSKS